MMGAIAALIHTTREVLKKSDKEKETPDDEYSSDNGYDEYSKKTTPSKEDAYYADRNIRRKE